jgi:hypothetical protein
MMAFDWLSSGSFVFARIIAETFNRCFYYCLSQVPRAHPRPDRCGVLHSAEGSRCGGRHSRLSDGARQTSEQGRDVLADLMAVGGSEEEPLDGALDSYAVTETSIQAVYAAKIGTSQERLAKVRGDYVIRQKDALDKLTPSLKRNVVKKVILIGLGLDFLPGKKSNNKFIEAHAFQPALWKEFHDQYGNMPSSSEADVALIVIPS